MVHLESCLNKDDAGGKNEGSTEEDLPSDHDEEISGLQCASCRQPFDDFEELKMHVENCKSRLMTMTPEVSITEVNGADSPRQKETKVFARNQMSSDANGPRQKLKPSLTIERYISEVPRVNFFNVTFVTYKYLNFLGFLVVT
jgi:hypothetical protein